MPWGLQNEDNRNFCFLRVRVVEAQALPLPPSERGRLLESARALWQLVAARHGGELLNKRWESDGGTIVFLRGGNEEAFQSATAAAIELAESCSALTTNHSVGGHGFRASVAVHYGDGTYRARDDTLESTELAWLLRNQSQIAEPGSVAATEPVFSQLPRALQDIFHSDKEVDGRRVHTYRTSAARLTAAQVVADEATQVAQQSVALLALLQEVSVAYTKKLHPLLRRASSPGSVSLAEYKRFVLAESGLNDLLEHLRLAFENEKRGYNYKVTFWEHPRKASGKRQTQALSISGWAYPEQATPRTRVLNIAVKQGQACVGHAWALGEPYVAEDVSTDPHFLVFYSDQARLYGSLICVPIYDTLQPDERPFLGVLCLAAQVAGVFRSRERDERRFDAVWQTLKPFMTQIVLFQAARRIVEALPNDSVPKAPSSSAKGKPGRRKFLQKPKKVPPKPGARPTLLPPVAVASLASQLPVMPEGRFPNLRVCARKKRSLVSFSNCEALMVVHFLPDLGDFLNAFRLVGLQPDHTHLFYKQYQYKAKQSLIERLLLEGYRVRPLDELEEGALAGLDAANAGKRRVVIVEDGGYLVPLLHGPLKDHPATVLGAVEQTERGLRNDELLGELRFPVLDVARCDVKDRHESPHVGRAIVRNIQNLLPDRALAGMRSLVIGYGSIGERVAEALRSESARVAVYDIRAERLLSALRSGIETDEHLPNLLHKAQLVVGCTGETSLKEEHLSCLQGDGVLVSGSSGRLEIGVPALDAYAKAKAPVPGAGTEYELEPDGRRVLLLADGYPVNFHDASSGVPNDVIDVTLSALFLCACALVAGASLPAGILHDEVNALLADEKLEQQAYSMAAR